MLIRPSRDAIHRLVRVALEEDAPWGDLTSQSLIPASAHVTARLVARELGVLSGEDVFTRRHVAHRPRHQHALPSA